MSLSSRLAVGIVATELEGLAETLASARSFATQVLVGVGRETPETGLLARSSGAQVVELETSSAAADARNACLKAMTTSWVLWLEPGERITATGIDALEELLGDAASYMKAFRCLVCNPGIGKQPSVECKAELRLHPRLPAARFQGLIRETIEDSLQAAGCQLEYLNLRIERPASATEASRRKRKANRILLQLDSALEARPVAPRTLNGLADALQTIGDTTRAAAFYRDALALATRRSADELEAWYGLLTALDGSPEGREAQLHLCMQALESFPVDAQLLCALGGYLHALGHHDLSAQAYFVAWKHGQVMLSVEHLEDIREIAALCHASGLAQLGRQDQACRFLQQALARDPDFTRLEQALETYTAAAQSQPDRSRALRLDAAGPVRSSALMGSHTESRSSASVRKPL